MSEQASINDDKENPDYNEITPHKIIGFGKFPGNWDKEKLVDCCKIRDSKRIPLNSKEREEKKPGDIPYYGANGVLDYIDDYIFDGEYVLLAEDGGHFGDYQNRPIAYKISGKAWVNNHAHILEADNGVIADWLLYSLQHRNLVPYVGGSTRSKLTQTMLKKVNIPKPPLPEQRKIATVLYNVDQAIQKTEEIIEQTKRVKKGLMQDLFIEGYYEHDEYIETKFGKTPSKWRISKISDIAKQIRSGGTPDTSRKDYYEGNIPWVKTGELKKDVIFDTEQKITEKGYKESAAKLFPADTILVAMYGATTGETARLGIEATTNQACCGIQVKEEMIDSYFLHKFLEYNKDRLTSFSAGSGQQNIRKGIIEKFDILIPPIREQQKISSIIKPIENQIKNNKIYKANLKKIKKGLMQDLLTGEVRTHDKDIEILDEVMEVENNGS